MKRIIFFLSLSLMAVLNAQPPVNWSHSDYFSTNWHGQFNSVTSTLGGGAIATGEFDTENRYLFVKVDANGNELWKYTEIVPNSVRVVGTEVIELSSGSYVGVGYIEYQDGSIKGYMIKFGPLGAKIDEVTFKTSEYTYAQFYTVYETPIGELIVGGRVWNNGEPAVSWEIKAEPYLDIIWLKAAWLGTNYSVITLTENGQTRHAFMKYYDEDIHVMRFKDNGDFSAETSITQNANWIGSMTKSNNGFTVLFNTKPIYPLTSNYIAVKSYKYVGSAYTEQFFELYGGNGFQTVLPGGRQIVQTPDNGFAFVATTESDDLPGYKGKKDAYVVKTNSTGQPEWQYCYGFSNKDDWGLSIDNTPDSGLIIAGRNRDTRPWLMKLGGNMSTDEVNQSLISIYPNPVKEILNIESKKTVQKIEIFNLNGQMVQSSLKPVNGKVDVSSLNPGTFVLKAEIAGEDTQTVKFIKK